MRGLFKKSIVGMLVLVMCMGLLSVTAMAADDETLAADSVQTLSDVSNEVVTYAANSNALVIDSDRALSNVTVNGDVYIVKDVTLTTTDEVTISGSVYVFGTLINRGTLTVSGTLHCLHYNNMMSAGANYDYGYFTNYGSAKISTLDVTSGYLGITIPEGTTGGSEAFAIYSADDTSLSFYTDDTVPTEGSTYKGETVTKVYEDVDKLEATYENDIPWYDNCESITNVEIDSTFKNAQPESLAFWFCEFGNCTAIEGLENLDTSNVTDMTGLFYGCFSLTELDVSGFDTSNVQSMDRMFSFCFRLTSIDVSGFDTSNVTEMGDIFDGCSGLTSVDVSGFDTSNVTDMSGLFKGCTGLTELDVSGWDMSSVTGMPYMFSGCSSLTSLDVSGFDTSNVIDMDSMFSDCISLVSLDVSGWDTSNVMDMSAIFCNCKSLVSLDLSGWDTVYAGIKYYTDFAIGCTSLEHIVLGEKTNIFTKGQLVDQQTWYDSPTNGKVTSANYLQDAAYPGEYWSYTTDSGTGSTGSPSSTGPNTGSGGTASGSGGTSSGSGSGSTSSGSGSGSTSGGSGSSGTSDGSGSGGTSSGSGSSDAGSTTGSSGSDGGSGYNGAGSGSGYSGTGSSSGSGSSVSSAKTDDSATPYLYLSLILIAGVAIATVGIRRRTAK